MAAAERNRGSLVRANAIDRGIALFAPRYAARRMLARSVLALYEGGRSTRRRRKSRDNSTGERLVVRDAATVRATIRDLERNYDLVDGALSSLVRNIIGPSGISIEPTPRVGTPGEKYDSIDDDFSRNLLNLWREWCISPEVTRTLNWVQAQELACRSWLRDGEMFAQLVEGSAAHIKHTSRVPLSIELLEADVVPLDHDRDAPNIQAGIERNEWGAPLAYWVYRRHPGNGQGFVAGDLKRVPAERFLHVAVRRRLSGLRGISLFASAIDRLLDIKDYEESERTAARIAARIAAYIKRDKEMDWTPPVDEAGLPVERDFLLEAGAIFTDTAPGESIEMINPNRPNTVLEQFRTAMMRAVSRAIGLSHSSLSGDYDGTYSAQRQELVESYDGYRAMTQTFVARFVQPIWERFVTLAIASGQIKVPPHVRLETVAQASFRGPKMPWIDPVKESAGERSLVRAGFKSVTQVIAERGGRMQDVFEEIHRERELAAELGLIFDSDARYTSSSGVTQARPDGSTFQDVDDEDEQQSGRDSARKARMRLVRNRGDSNQ